MQKALVSWIGGNDLDAMKSNLQGPILRTLLGYSYDEVYLLYNYPEEPVNNYISWLCDQVKTRPIKYYCKLTSPVNFGEIYFHANKLLEDLEKKTISPDILLSPGTPAMQAVWILLGKTKYQSKFIQSSVEQGVHYVDIPFSIAAEYTPTAKQIENQNFLSVANVGNPTNPAFQDIITRNPAMKKLIAQAEILAQKDVPVLINGETGTGKELFARAIHHASTRSNKPFIAINCGAITR